MNAPAFIHEGEETLSEAISRFTLPDDRFLAVAPYCRMPDASRAQIYRGDVNAAVLAAAKRVTDATYPREPAPHGFYEFSEFVDPARSRRAVARNDFYRTALRILGRRADDMLAARRELVS